MVAFCVPTDYESLKTPIYPCNSLMLKKSSLNAPISMMPEIHILKDSNLPHG